MLGYFFNKLAEIQAVSYPQDAQGGETLIAATAAVLVPCCCQQDGSPVRNDAGEWRRGSTGRYKVFFNPTDRASLMAVLAIVAKSSIKVTGGPFDPRQTLIAEGPAVDDSGRGASLYVACVEEN